MNHPAEETSLDRGLETKRDKQPDIRGTGSVQSVGVEEVIRSIRQVARAVGLFGRELWSNWGISPSQLAALEIVAAHESMSAGELADQMRVSPATVTRIVGSLEQKELVERSRGARDRRRVMISITPRGATLIDDVPRSLQALLERRLAILPDTRRSAVLQGLKDLVVLLGAEDVDASPILSVETHLDADHPTDG